MLVQADGSPTPLLNQDNNNIIEYVREASSNQNDAQVTAGVTSGQSGHQRKFQNSGSGFGKAQRARRSFNDVPEVSMIDIPMVDLEFGVQEDGTTKLLKRNNREPSNSCHCVWVSPNS